ncbi:MAG TPA: DUF4249 family protein, partial [Bacteroidales bacterium]|nr:DUF4249 family protein [Bacteroidales bacterium]
KCWKTSSIKKFFITRSLASGSAQEQTIPLHFVPFNTRQFSVRYSLQVTQLAVSEEIYNYYYKINQQNKSGSLYSSQPYSIPGNIHNTNNPREQVLGSFAAGGIYQKRDFFNSPFFAKFSYQTCVPVTDPLVVGAAIAIGGTREAPLYITEVQGAKGISSDECFVCALRGGSPVKPDFWVDPYQK